MRFFLLLCCVFSASVFANCDKNACNSTVSRVYVTNLSDKSVYIKVNETDYSTLNCSLAEGTYFKLKGDHQSYDQIYSMALAALAAKMKVRIRAEEASSGCLVSYMWVDAN